MLAGSYRRRLDDGDGLDNLLLVQLRTGSVEVAHNGAHASLVAHGGCEVDRLLGVILGEAGGCQLTVELLAAQSQNTS
jgi:hypothetical protein